MVDTLSSLRKAIDDRLGELRAVMTDEPIEIVTRNYEHWKEATRGALAGLFLQSVVERFDLARGVVDPKPGRRPTPLVFLDGAASRAFLTALKKELDTNPAAVLLEPPSAVQPADPFGDLREVLDLLERRMPHAFRGRPTEERHLQLGFETLLAGAEVKWESGGQPIGSASATCVPDFTFPDLKTALKLKLCDGPGREEVILDEMHDEITALTTRYERIIFAVCDFGHIRNRVGFVERFASHEGVVVRVLAL